jgi:hypothetical protein
MLLDTAQGVNAKLDAATERLTAYTRTDAEPVAPIAPKPIAPLEPDEDDLAVLPVLAPATLWINGVLYPPPARRNPNERRTEQAVHTTART